jgi:hypothetical protein
MYYIKSVFGKGLLYWVENNIKGVIREFKKIVAVMLCYIILYYIESEINCEIQRRSIGLRVLLHVINYNLN